MSDSITNALEELAKKVSAEKRIIMNFNQFLEKAKLEPQKVFRNIFQLFSDMVKTYIKEEKDEYPNDPESIGYIEYDCSELFVKDLDNPYFADRLFANRFVRQMESLRRGVQQNKVYVFVGPPGSGKSIFLNNLLQKFEEYTNTEAGRCYEIYWQIDENFLNNWNNINIQSQKFEVPCPSHDHPILIIPRKYRSEFLELLVSKQMYKLFSEEKEYEWLFKEEACTICQSLFSVLFEKFGSLDRVLEMVKVRSYKFNRRLGEGISVFNPGDKPSENVYLTDKQIQEKLDKAFGANLVKYVFSSLAKTNNGIYALMDIKSYNKDRLLELHNIISEGVHKVDNSIEEKINSLFFALMNPEDKEEIEKNGKKSFQARIQYNKILYVLNASTEVKIYRRVFGEIDKYFLPRVLENFAKVIIASRMKTHCEPLKNWIKDIEKYKKYCDENGLLLRMELYNGIIPSWLSEEDKKRFTKEVRQKIIAEAENEGYSGISVRDSIQLCEDFLSRYRSKPNLITMDDVKNFFTNKLDKGVFGKDYYYLKEFTESLMKFYNYNVVEEMKEAMYFYNKEQISIDILNYLCAINYKIGDKVKCQFTNQQIEVTIDFLKLVGGYISGKRLNDSEAVSLAEEIQKKYVKVIVQTLKITETEFYKELFNDYVRNLKERVLEPFINNDSFRQAIKAYSTKSFETFDTKIKERIVHMITNLINEFGYTEKGAQQICLYIIEKGLIK